MHRVYEIDSLISSEKKDTNTIYGVPLRICKISAKSERKVLSILEGDCYTAVGVYSKINNNDFEITGELFSIDGKKRYYKKIKDKTSNYLNASTELGNYLKLEAKDTYKT